MTAKHLPKKKPAFGANESRFGKSTIQQNGRKADLFNFRLNGRQTQCSRCGELSSRAICFDCDQLAEFIFREHPDDYSRRGIDKILGGAK